VTDVVARARGLAAGVLAPAAAAAEAAGTVPAASLDALADAGLYGLTGPVDAGGLGAEPATVGAVVEELAAGDLATAFVWLQHLGVVGRLAAAGPPELPAARAAAAALAHRAAGALVVATGSSAVLAGSVAERTAREALFLLVIGSRPAIKEALLADLGAAAPRR
jgi:alkylation response protein AidB-like acyl-CoA dehydrogenase